MFDVDLQIPVLHWSDSDEQSGREPAAHEPETQASPTVHPSPSASHGRPSLGAGSFSQMKLFGPLDQQEPALHASDATVQSASGPTVQVPETQVSPTVQPLPSALQRAPSFAAASARHVKPSGPSGSQAPAWH